MAERGSNEAVAPGPGAAAPQVRARPPGAGLLGRRPRAALARGRVARYYNLYVAPPRYRAEQRLTLTAADGVRLNAWLLPGPPDALCTFVLVHGFVNSSRSPVVHRFAHLLNRRAHVVVPDLRGHGRSSGLCSMGRNEPLDVAAAVAAAPPGLPVVTIGTSLGGAAVLMHAGASGGVAGVVGISAPAWGDLDRVGTHRVRKLVSGRVGRLVLAAALRTRVGPDCIYLPDAGSLVARIAPAFTVVVHDPEDWYFSPRHAESIHEWAKEPKALWWYPGGGHGGDLLTEELAGRILAETAARLAGASAVGESGDVAALDRSTADDLSGAGDAASGPPTS
ncbi:MAG: alpha/beta hydrolase [Acidimicrobiales bacterium]